MNNLPRIWPSFKEKKTMVLKTTDWVIEMVEDAERLQPAAWVEKHGPQFASLFIKEFDAKATDKTNQPTKGEQ